MLSADMLISGWGPGGCIFVVPLSILGDALQSTKVPRKVGHHQFHPQHRELIDSVCLQLSIGLVQQRPQRSFYSNPASITDL